MGLTSSGYPEFLPSVATNVNSAVVSTAGARAEVNMLGQIRPQAKIGPGAAQSAQCNQELTHEILNVGTLAEAQLSQSDKVFTSECSLKRKGSCAHPTPIRSVAYSQRHHCRAFEVGYPILHQYN